MMGLAAFDSHAIRCLLRQPLRPRFTLRCLAPSPLSIHRTFKAQKGATKKLESQQFLRDRTRKEAESTPPSNLPDFSLPEPPALSEVVWHLQGRLKQLVDNRPFSLRITEWMINDDSLRNLLKVLVPEEESIIRSSRNVMIELLKLWSKEALEALESLEGKNPVSSAYWDMEEIYNSYQGEGRLVYDRLCVNSFLRWLETNLESQPGNSDAVAHIRILLSIADMRYAPLKYYLARSLTRHIHLHVGPTNSGKTHGALLALCKANTGLYAGPLRLLAHEVWDRINSGTVSPGIAPRACNLKTGEEVKVTDELAGLSACTVEMVNVSKLIDVAVIDEIQMIGDPQRGFAWTNAVLGLPAKEMHLCGESSVIPLIKRMAEACGDVVHIHEYKRLTPLQIGEPLMGDLTSIRKGDCLVAFSRSEIFRLKRIIEQQTPFKCALAYGALPPETKSEQAKIFNDPENEVSVMVASDAIGMGLNLKIKRIIFSTLRKWNGSEMVSISASQIKQIAGRAGRYGTTSEQETEGGFVTTLEPGDLPILEAALAAPLVPITRAAIQPSSDDLNKIATTLPTRKGFKMLTPVSRGRGLLQLYEDLQLLTRVDSTSYFASSIEQQAAVAPLIEGTVPMSMSLPIAERELFAVAPANVRDEKLMALLANMVGYHIRSELVDFAKCDLSLGMLQALRSMEKIQVKLQNEIEDTISRGGEFDSEMRTNILGRIIGNYKTPPTIESMMVLESLHRGLTLYLWLSFRLPLSFCYRENVEKLKERTESAIALCLEVIKVARADRLAARETMGDAAPRGVRQTSRPQRRPEIDRIRFYKYDGDANDRSNTWQDKVEKKRFIKRNENKNSYNMSPSGNDHHQRPRKETSEMPAWRD